jgi:hypothetical protein
VNFFRFFHHLVAPMVGNSRPTKGGFTQQIQRVNSPSPSQRLFLFFWYLPYGPWSDHINFSFQTIRTQEMGTLDLKNLGPKFVFIRCRFFFWVPIMWGRWDGDHPQVGLAKFGYRLEREVESFVILPMLWRQDKLLSFNITLQVFASISAEFEHNFPRKSLRRFTVPISFCCQVARIHH